MEQVVKRRLRTLGPRLQQELQVTIPHDLDRLESYRAAIENSQRAGDWDTLRRDQRNATLTIKVHTVYTTTTIGIITAATGSEDPCSVAGRLERGSARGGGGSV